MIFSRNTGLETQKTNMNYGFFDILTLLGSLGLFLYGMKVMSDALMKLAGDRMRNVLAVSTSNRFFALFTGFAITAVIQSSSATTLMVISFVNASLLTLTEAVGVIMGANIGTTVTAWLISILGFKVKISALAIPLAGFGFLLSLSKNKQYRDSGLFIVGFAILFIGLQFLKPLFLLFLGILGHKFRHILDRHHHTTQIPAMPGGTAHFSLIQVCEGFAGNVKK